MVKKKQYRQVDGHLKCKSTASLDSQIVEDLQKEDKSLAQILDDETETDEECQQDAQE